MYKLDIGWPKTPEHFTGQTFCVAVDSLHGLVYVGQVSGNTVFLSIVLLFLPLKCLVKIRIYVYVYLHMFTFLYMSE